MPKATLIFPSSYNVAGKGFKRDKPQTVSVEQAVYLSTVENFDVDFEGMTPAEVQKYMFDLEKVGNKPADIDLLHTQIRLALAALDPEDAANLTKDNRVDSRALARVLGYTVTSLERDDALGYPPAGTPVTTARQGKKVRLSRGAKISIAGDNPDSQLTQGVEL